MDKTIDFSSLKSEITADKVIDLARKHNDNETLNETLRRKGDIYERRNNYVSSEIWSDAFAPSGRKTIGEYGYTTSATKSTYLHHAAIYHHSEYRMNHN